MAQLDSSKNSALLRYLGTAMGNPASLWVKVPSKCLWPCMRHIERSFARHSFGIFFGIRRCNLNEKSTLDIQNPPNTWWIGVQETLKSLTSGDVKGGSNIDPHQVFGCLGPHPQKSGDVLIRILLLNRSHVCYDYTNYTYPKFINHPSTPSLPNTFYRSNMLVIQLLGGILFTPTNPC